MAGVSGFNDNAEKKTFHKGLLLRFIWYYSTLIPYRGFPMYEFSVRGFFETVQIMNFYRFFVSFISSLLLFKKRTVPKTA